MVATIILVAASTVSIFMFSAVSRTPTRSIRPQSRDSNSPSVVWTTHGRRSYSTNKILLFKPKLQRDRALVCANFQVTRLWSLADLTANFWVTTTSSNSPRIRSLKASSRMRTKAFWAPRHYFHFRFLPLLTPKREWYTVSTGKTCASSSSERTSGSIRCTSRTSEDIEESEGHHFDLDNYFRIIYQRRLLPIRKKTQWNW